MPATLVCFYRDARGSSPVRAWLRALRKTDARAHARCVARIERLAEQGHELRRPEADYLNDGVYELRAKRGHVNYRILYCFCGKNVAILLHALTKESVVPIADIERALARKRLVLASPDQYIEEE